MAKNIGFPCTRCNRHPPPGSLPHLVEHLKVHQKPWICATCGHGYARHDAFATHVRARHAGRAITAAEQATGDAICDALKAEARGQGFVLPPGILLPVAAAAAAPPPAGPVAVPLPAPVVIAAPPPPPLPMAPPPVIMAAPPALQQQQQQQQQQHHHHQQQALLPPLAALPLPAPLPTGPSPYEDAPGYVECVQQ